MRVCVQKYVKNGEVRGQTLKASDEIKVGVVHAGVWFLGRADMLGNLARARVVVSLIDTHRTLLCTFLAVFRCRWSLTTTC